MNMRFIVIVRIEEATRHAAFGEEYASYVSRTRRFVPFLFPTFL